MQCPLWSGTSKTISEYFLEILNSILQVVEMKKSTPALEKLKDINKNFSRVFEIMNITILSKSGYIDPCLDNFLNDFLF